jgi:hypothetical protein
MGMFGDEAKAVSFSWMRHMVVPGVLAAVLAITAQFFRLMNAQPKEGLELLEHWGPNFLLGILIVAIVGGLLSQVVEISRDGVSAQNKMAEAMTRVAEKDDRQLQEIQTLAAYNAQESTRMHQRFDSTERLLLHISTQLGIAAPEERDAKAMAKGANGD